MIMMMVMMMMMIMTSRERTDKTRNLEEERIVKNKRTKGNTKVKRGKLTPKMFVYSILMGYFRDD